MKTSQDSRPPLRARPRLIVAGILEIAMVLVGLQPEWDYGIYNKTKFWYAANNFFKEFLVVLLPTVAILFLLPVIVRGSLQQKIAATIIALIAACIAIPVWLEIIGDFSESIPIIFAH